MKSLLRCLTLLSLVGLSACTTVETKLDTSPAGVESYIAAGEYGRAQAAVKAVDETHPDYASVQAQGERLEVLIAQFVKQTLTKVDEALAKKEWARARGIIDPAVEKLPEHEELLAKRHDVVREHEHHLAILDAEANIAEAEHLVSKYPTLRDEVEDSTANIAAKWRLSSAETDLQTLARKLTDYSLRFIEYKDLGLAQRCLDSVAKIPGPLLPANILDARNSLAREQKRVAEEKARQDRARARANAKRKAHISKSRKAERRKRSAQLQKHIKEALREKEFPRARQLMDELSELDGGNAQVTILGERVNYQIATIVKQRLDYGNSLYRQERIEDAKKIWEEALPLDPDNIELLSNIRRAERVLENVEALRRGGNTKPAAKQ